MARDHAGGDQANERRGADLALNQAGDPDLARDLRNQHDMNPNHETQIRPRESLPSKHAILVVDDEAGTRESLKRILSPSHDVICAGSGPEALEILGSRDIALVTLDLEMPDVTGEELMRTARAEYPSVEVIVITGNSSVQTAVEGLRLGISDYITKPFDAVEVGNAVDRALNRRQSRTRLVHFLECVGAALDDDRDSVEVLENLTRNVERHDELGHTLGEQQRPARRQPLTSADAVGPSLELLDVIAQALEGRDRQLRRHAQQVQFYADLVAEQLDVDEETRTCIRTSSVLHDIGKLALGDEDKLHAQLDGAAEGTPEQQHGLTGATLAQRLGFEERITRAIRHHHEHWNGGGHPDGLEGENIPLAARVIAVVDSFDRLTSERPGARALSAGEATATLEKYAGSRFDPAVVAVFVRLVESGSFELEASGARR
ncbi:MAG: HD domain-containing phosphohydrolase [Myxococcota bacterium]|nr:HD domain-containing phosphohydrolase [Myxococcota bacterium]